MFDGCILRANKGNFCNIHRDGILNLCAVTGCDKPIAPNLNQDRAMLAVGLPPLATRAVADAQTTRLAALARGSLAVALLAPVAVAVAVLTKVSLAVALLAPAAVAVAALAPMAVARNSN